MGRNNLQGLGPSSLAAVSAQAAATIGSAAGNPYRIDPESVVALSLQASNLETAEASVSAAKAAYRAAIQSRDAKAATCVDSLAAIARQVYAEPTVTPSMIADLGLSPRSTSRTRIVPKTPVGLAVLVQSNGGLLLKWDRYGNAEGVNFVIEALVGNDGWAYVRDTARCRIVLSGYAPGEAVSFRVRASKNGITSPPCAPVSVYATVASPALRMAA